MISTWVIRVAAGMVILVVLELAVIGGICLYKWGIEEGEDGEFWKE